MKGFKLKRITLGIVLISLLLGGSVYVSAESREDNFLKEYTVPQPWTGEYQPISFLATLFKLGFSLVIIIVLIYLTIYGLKKVSSKYRPASLIDLGLFTILDSLVLGPNKNLHLISLLDKRILVVFASDKDICVLDKIEDSQQVSEILAKVREKWNKTNPFKEHLKIAQRKRLAQEYLQDYIRNLKGVVSGFLRSPRSL